MARSFTKAKLFSAFVVDGISNAICRRGYAAASQGVVSGVVRGSGPRSGVMIKKSGEEMVGSTEKVSWVPDPVTGYYRPENRTNELDMADLRALLLKNNN